MKEKAMSTARLVVLILVALVLTAVGRTIAAVSMFVHGMSYMLDGVSSILLAMFSRIADTVDEPYRKAQTKKNAIPAEPRKDLN